MLPRLPLLTHTTGGAHGGSQTFCRPHSPSSSLRHCPHLTLHAWFTVTRLHSYSEPFLKYQAISWRSADGPQGLEFKSWVSGTVQCATCSHLTTYHTLCLVDFLFFQIHSVLFNFRAFGHGAPYLYAIPPSSFCISRSLFLINMTSVQILAICSRLFWFSHSTLKTSAILCLIMPGSSFAWLVPLGYCSNSNWNELWRGLSLFLSVLSPDTRKVIIVLFYLKFLLWCCGHKSNQIVSICEKSVRFCEASRKEKYLYETGKQMWSWQDTSSSNTRRGGITAWAPGHLPADLASLVRTVELSGLI